MHVNDLKYIFDNIEDNKINLYSNVKTLTVMRQYVSKIKDLGYNHEVYHSENGQLALKLLRKDGTCIGRLENPKYPENVIYNKEITGNKMSTEKILTVGGIGTTHSHIYSLDQLKEARSEFFSLYPDKLAVIKPLDMSQGKGVSVRVTEENFEFYWNRTKDVMEQNSRKKGKIIVQEYLEGFEARAVVISGKLISVVARVPAHVKGNGKDSVLGLIKRKNTLRKKCGHLRKKLIEPNNIMEKFLKDDNISFSYIPKKNEYILLTSISNTSLGGDMIDITDYISEEIRELALDGIAAIPGYMSGGVDIMMRNFGDKNPRIIEINRWPFMQSTIYPTYGKSHDPQGYFLNSFFARDQYLNKPKDKYEIENIDEYVSTYLQFLDRKKVINTKLFHYLI